MTNLHVQRQELTRLLREGAPITEEHIKQGAEVAKGIGGVENLALYGTIKSKYHLQQQAEDQT